MNPLRCVALAIASVALAMLAGCAAPSAPVAAHAPSGALVAIPPGKDNDLKLYLAGGGIIRGADAMERMPKEAGVILWLAGNQFFAMDDVVRAFQARNPSMSVGLITLPPGLLASAIEAGGWRLGTRTFPGRPDVFASVSLGHLSGLKQSGLMSRYATYMHNEMVLMVARGNPKGIKDIGDVIRPGVRTSMPNPINEGIMQFYARKVLERRGLWQGVSGGMECISCQATPANWFTAVHHRETPERILADTSDTGIVWLTDRGAARRKGRGRRAPSARGQPAGRGRLRDRHPRRESPHRRGAPLCRVRRFRGRTGALRAFRIRARNRSGTRAAPDSLSTKSAASNIRLD